MAPSQTRKRKSGEMATPEAVTPSGSPAPKKMRITVSQKQALIDNLQLEGVNSLVFHERVLTYYLVTERARRLRAQYAIQCKDLRSRIERRIHRIPIAMRNMTMAELMNQHQETKKPAPTSPIKAAEHALPIPPQLGVPSVSSTLPQSLKRQKIQQDNQILRSRKRKSSEIHIASDKENDHEHSTAAPEALPVTKNTKRTKTTATRTTSRTQKPAASVLSPRSHNSRTLPRSPIKEKDYTAPPSPSKLQQTSYIARPISPLKPNSPLKSAATAATSAISASVHGMIEHARNRAALSKPTRTNSVRKASKETNPISATGTTRTTAKAAPRPISAMSSHSIDTDISTATDNTVITKIKRVASKKVMAPPAKPVKATTAARASPAAKTALKKNATGPVKKVVVAEPAIGKRVLRKRA